MRILICWELGSGMGHVRRMTPLVHGLRARGHQVLIAARDVVSAVSALNDPDIEIIAAPVCMRGAPRLPASASYPEVLLRVGYSDAEILQGLLSAWGHLFRLIRADAIIAEHAPTALLAARIAQLPATAIGTGFSVPPEMRPMPALPSYKPVPSERLLTAERCVLHNIRQATGRNHPPPIQTLAELFPAQRSFVCSYPELDHYGERADIRYHGAIEPFHSAQMPPQWPEGGKTPVFVYLHHGYPQFAGLVRQLQAGGYRTLVVSPGIPQELANKLSGPSMRVMRQSVDLNRVAEQPCAVITHCGHGATARLLLLGIPLILLPNYVEQTVLAYRLARQGLALMMNPDPSQHRYAAAIDKLRNEPAYRHRAQTFSARHATPDQSVRVSDLLDAVLHQLTDPIR